eukprot:TRINITY_DN5470_c0_g1_i1.p1 TRINITY_DN5470_c0_g1~~TRINITY_DN5470_c0_g1_i1.p1  ORF type:complete len:414 (-),score=47.84 TRINITY_DN5470_c0_g1_i1:157-1398(-)
MAEEEKREVLERVDERKEDEEESFLKEDDDDEKPVVVAAPEAPKETLIQKISRITMVTPEDFQYYKTNQELRIRNRNLGYTEAFFCFVILSYIIVYLVLIEQLVFDTEKSYGVTSISANGRMYSVLSNGKVHIWDPTDILPIRDEIGAILIPTRIKVTKDQKLATCPAPVLLPCITDEDCQEDQPIPNYVMYRKCQQTSSGFKGCLVRQWCPAQNPKDRSATITHDVLGIPQTKITVKTGISFKSLKADKTYSNQEFAGDQEYPHPMANVFTLESLLKMAGTTYENVKYIGGVFALNIRWECNVDINYCRLYNEIEKLDPLQSNGFGITTAKYFTIGGEEIRDEIQIIGIRILVNCYGTGKKFSIIRVVDHIFTGLALMAGAKLINDILMLTIYTEKRHYGILKYIPIKLKKD